MAAEPLAGTIAATATVVAGYSVITSHVLAGTIAAASSIAIANDVTVSETHALAGSIAATGVVSCAAGREWNLTAQPVPAAAGIVMNVSVLHPLAGSIPARAEVTARVEIEGQGLLVRDVVHSALSLLEAGCGCELPDDPCLQAAVMVQVNAALQTIYARADQLGYFSRETVTLAFESGEESRAFDRVVQGVLGPVREESSRIVLREVTDRAQFDRFTEVFYGGAVPDGPRAYHLRSANATGGDSVMLALHLTPTPTQDTNILVDVILEPPRYAWTDVVRGTALQLPHRYAETLLIPLVREWATSHEFFTEQELLPQITQQAAIARETLGRLGGKLRVES